MSSTRERRTLEAIDASVSIGAAPLHEAKKMIERTILHHQNFPLAKQKSFKGTKREKEKRRKQIESITDEVLYLPRWNGERVGGSSGEST